MSGEVELDRGAMGPRSWRRSTRQSPCEPDARAAVRGYLFGLANREPFGESGDLWIYPSLNELRAHLATTQPRTPAGSTEEATS